MDSEKEKGERMSADSQIEDAHDWRKPRTIEEAFECARRIAEGACEGTRKQLGYGPRPVRTATGFDIVWPDGEVTNQIDVEWQQ